MLIDPSRQILSANSCARRILAAAAVLTAHNGRLVCALSAHERRLSAAISLLLRSPRPPEGGRKCERVPLHFANGMPAQSLLGCVRLIHNGQPSLLLALVSHREDADLDNSLAVELFGFTPAEARLARRVISGCELSEIAAESRLSLETARSHLKSVFAKTETHRQAELVSLLLRLGGC